MGTIGCSPFLIENPAETISLRKYLVLFFNVSNPLGYRNSYGYRYVNSDYSELSEPEEKLPQSLRSVFVGCFMFFSVNKNK